MIGIENKTTPLVDYFESLGFQAHLDSGKKRIKVFTSSKDENRVLYEGVGVVDLSYLGIIELKGKDVLDFLHRITTNDLKDLPKEGIRKTIFTTEKARIIDLSTILNFEDFQLSIGGSENKSKVIGWIKKYVITDDVKVNDANGKYTLLELVGPQADSFITLVCGSVVNDLKPNTFRIISTDGMLFFLMKILDENDNVRFRFLADVKNSQQLLTFMLENKGIFDFAFIGEDAYESYRIENSIAGSPNELNDNYNPHEADITKFVNFKKGCYIGQEVMARLETYDKVQKKLVSIKFESDVDNNNSYNIIDSAGNEVGLVTSSILSLRFNEYFGLAYIRRGSIESGEELFARDKSGKSIRILLRNQKQ
ncbi:MAG: aminomethyl transferase family protein [Ignavibacteriaceae bacterium]|nr:aminomethyl transferase family protein [Ignavibacteriaceae bacterium]